MTKDLSINYTKYQWEILLIMLQNMLSLLRFILFCFVFSFFLRENFKIKIKLKNLLDNLILKNKIKKYQNFQYICQKISNRNNNKNFSSVLTKLKNLLCFLKLTRF